MSYTNTITCCAAFIPKWLPHRQSKRPPWQSLWGEIDSVFWTLLCLVWAWYILCVWCLVSCRPACVAAILLPYYFDPCAENVQLQMPILCRLPWVPGWLPLFPFLDEASHQSMNAFSTQVQVPTSRATRTSTRPVRRPTPSPAAPTYRQTKLKSQAQGRIRRKRWDFTSELHLSQTFFILDPPFFATKNPSILIRASLPNLPRQIPWDRSNSTFTFTVSNSSCSRVFVFYLTCTIKYR